MNSVDSAQIPVVTVRYSSNVPPSARRQLYGSTDAFDLLWPHFEPHQEVQEAFRVVLMDRGNRVKGVYTMSLGGLHATVADPKLIYSVALRTLSSAIIVAHNHPSGQTRPSEEDIRLTRKLKEGAALLDIALNDHIIVCGPGCYYSFADNGML